MGGRHRFAGEDRTVRPLLAAVVPVVAVAGMTVAVMLSSNGEATSTPRIEVPRFSSSDTAAAAPTSAGLPAALPTGAPAVLQLSGAGTSAVQRVVAEREQAAAAEEAARERAARAARAAARERAAVPTRPAPPQVATAPATPAPEPSVAQDPDTSPTPQTQERPRGGGLLGSLFGGR